jgi:hypothetical protein
MMLEGGGDLMYRVMIIASALSVAACTITQEVKPIEHAASTEVCIIENPEVRSGFLKEYEKSLAELGYRTRRLPQGSPLTSCTVTSTYVGQWSYDWFWTSGVYMSLAEIKVYHDGQLAGTAVFDTTKGQASLKRVVDAEPKIKELVTELFPRVQ